VVENLKFQIVYECPDLDFQASYEKLVQSNLVTADTYEKGNLWVHFKNVKVLFVISPKGKIQVAFEDPKQKEILLEILKKLLVSTTGHEVVFNPLQQNITVEYPAPKEIELWWCEKKDSYIHQDEAKYRRITDCPEFSEADWSKISRKDKKYLIKLWIYGDCVGEFSPESGEMVHDMARYLLKSHALEKDSKPLKEKMNKMLTLFRPKKDKWL